MVTSTKHGRETNGIGNLVLTRRENEAIRIEGPCEVEVVQIGMGRVRLAIRAAKSVAIVRTELDPAA